ncbi:radical SAM protein [Actinobacteria bacterium YIM 96077]|uniref:Radical SAM protein n=1 Tax=Phytoactinopolyspora halophila TaxID=1981511 RepID=A0A329QH58_9ACTN|nr:Rv2578c family radical SAM protein [Phytoactinopolyspora halophila]AYY14659.1 radical SAM protein [Actinobacteria bacterium YIM 96077]RAW11630.1 radical SAM protein [Phytoactinopolyspora halophila]
MRWAHQTIDALDAKTDEALPGLPRIPGLVRSVRTPEFAGVTFHEVAARSVLNKVTPSSQVPFGWTINPYRGCTHACRFCFARGSHEWLELDAGQEFDTEIVVKVNAPDVLAREVARPSWSRDHVALGTNTDPYQRAEGRYRLMPGIIRALAGSGTPFSILTKGPLLKRDLPLLMEASASVDVSVAVSIAMLDRRLHESIEPGTPSPRARLDLVRAIRAEGFECRVMLAPVMPWLNDSAEQLEEIVTHLADAGASAVTTIPLHLRPATRTWFMRWLEAEHPELVPRYQELYRRGAYLSEEYRAALRARVQPILRRHGLAARNDEQRSSWRRSETGRRRPVPEPDGQLRLI